MKSNFWWNEEKAKIGIDREKCLNNKIPLADGSRGKV
jgi:hypothetical protein